jgi:hypothetical protein
MIVRGRNIDLQVMTLRVALSALREQALITADDKSALLQDV